MHLACEKRRKKVTDPCYVYLIREHTSPLSQYTGTQNMQFVLTIHISFQVHMWRGAGCRIDFPGLCVFRQLGHRYRRDPSRRSALWAGNPWGRRAPVQSIWIRRGRPQILSLLNTIDSLFWNKHVTFHNSRQLYECLFLVNNKPFKAVTL